MRDEPEDPIVEDMRADHEVAAARIAARLAAGLSPNHTIGAGATTVLALACFHFRPKVVELLLDAGANPNLMDDYGHTALHWCRSEACLRRLLWAGADPSIKFFGHTFQEEIWRRSSDSSELWLMARFWRQKRLGISVPVAQKSFAELVTSLAVKASIDCALDHVPGGGKRELEPATAAQWLFHHYDRIDYLSEPVPPFNAGDFFEWGFKTGWSGSRALNEPGWLFVKTRESRDEIVSLFMSGVRAAKQSTAIASYIGTAKPNPVSDRKARWTNPGGPI